MCSWLWSPLERSAIEPQAMTDSQLSFSCRDYVALAATISIAQHPLLFRPDEYAVKWLLTLTSSALCASLLQLSPRPRSDQISAFEQSSVQPNMRMPAPRRRTSARRKARSRSVRTRLQSVLWWRWYLLGFVPLESYCAWGHAAIWGGGQRVFLPLMLSSVYCGVGVSCAWLRMFGEYVALCRSCK